MYAKERSLTKIDEIADQARNDGGSETMRVLR